MLTLIRNGDVYAPEHVGRASVLLANDRIEASGSLSTDKIEAAGLQLEVIDATDCYVVPGIIDPHAHLLGGSGESGFSTQTPEIFLSELVRGGTTTVVVPPFTSSVRKISGVCVLKPLSPLPPSRCACGSMMPGTT